LLQRKRFLLFPVVPDVLHIVAIFMMSMSFFIRNFRFRGFAGKIPGNDTYLVYGIGALLSVQMFSQLRARDAPLGSCLPAWKICLQLCPTDQYFLWRGTEDPELLH
jgi:hypothetical protein